MKKPRTGNVNIILHGIALLAFRMLGWKVQGPPPPFPKYVAVFAPHTSYWDAPIAILMTFVLGVSGNWMAKDGAFRAPFGWILRAIGGIPVERSSHHNFVDQAANVFAQNDRFILALAPEGTRKRTDHWKSGFYYIALKAQVPIVLAFFDHARKVAGNTGVVLYPTGDVDADLEIIRNTYASITPKHPECRSEVRFKDNAPPDHSATT